MKCSVVIGVKPFSSAVLQLIGVLETLGNTA